MLERTKPLLFHRTKPAGAQFIVIEDDLADAQLLEEAFKRSRYLHTWNLFRAGDEALAFLRSQDAPWKMSTLILLDLNLPGMDGRLVLSEIKSDPKLLRIPVIVLTTSDNPTDVQQAYERHANSYITKPTHLNQLHGIVKRIEEYWLETVQLPH